MRPKLKSALTVIELLVVVSIVAVVAGLLSLVVNAGLYSAKVSACTHNLANIGKAISLYANDNGGQMPPYPSIDYVHGSVDNTGLIVSSLMPYARSKMIFFCPLDKDWNHMTSQTTAGHASSSYMTSTAMVYLSKPEAYFKISLDQIKNPSVTQLMYDAFLLNTNERFGKTSHGDWKNTLFVDGRVKHLRLGSSEDLCQLPGLGPACPE